MKTTKRTLTALVVLAVLSVTSTLAGPRPQTQKTIPRVREFISVPAMKTTAGIGIGRPTTFSATHSWLTSDALSDPNDPNDFITDVVWFDTEMLTVLGGFYSLNTRETTVSVQIKNASGAVQFEDGFSSVLKDPDSIYLTAFDIGDLTPGAYKVIFKAKQGTKSVGQQYWINVFADVPGAALKSR